MQQENSKESEDGTGNLTSTYLINLVNDDVNQHVWNSSYPQYGLCLKTYQSDIFNNWIQTDWIDGENGINEITAIDTSSGGFKLDALILAKKVYNMLNRIAVSGGTYNDWIEAVYSTSYLSRAETPIYQEHHQSKCLQQYWPESLRSSSASSPHACWLQT